MLLKLKFYQVILTKYICNNLTLVCLLQESCLAELGLIEYNIGNQIAAQSAESLFVDAAMNV